MAKAASELARDPAGWAPVLRLRRFVFAAPTWRLAVALWLLTLVKAGVWQIPNFGASRLIAADPFTNPFPDPNAHALLWSWLGPFLAWLAGATGAAPFFLLHLAFSLAFTVLVAVTAMRRLPDREARVALVVFATIPAAATPYFWVSNDSLTLLLMALAVALPAAAAPVVGLALGMQHFEQALLGFGALLLALLLARRRPEGRGGSSLPRVLLLLAGIVGGKLALAALFWANGMEVNSGRLYWLRQHLPLLLAQFFLHTQVILFSALGLGWIVLVKFLERGRDRRALLLPLAAALLLLPISGDQTRVLAVVTFPLLATFWLLDRGFLAFLSDRFVTWLLLAWIVMPLAWVWAGEPRWSAFPYGVALLLNATLGWFELPADLPSWPLGS